MVNRLEWHDLQHYAIAHFRREAGYIPRQMPIDYDWIGELRISVRTRYFQSLDTTKVSVYKTVVKFETLCYPCTCRVAQHLTGFDFFIYREGVRDWDYCEICGKFGIEVNDQLPY